MKSVLFLIVLVVTYGYGDTMETIKSYCENEYGTSNDRVFKYCVDTQVEALNFLANFDDKELLTKCKNEWQNNFDMVKHCIETELKVQEYLKELK